MFKLLSSSKCVVSSSKMIRLFKPCQAVFMSTSQSEVPATKPNAASAGNNHDSMRPSRKLSVNQKRYLLLSGKYKSTAEIPDVLTDSQINTLYTRARIRLNMMLAVVVLITCILTIGSGRRALEEGDTLEKRNIDYHHKYNADNKDK